MLHLSYKIIVYFISFFVLYLLIFTKLGERQKTAKFNYSYFAIIGGSMTKLFNGNHLDLYSINSDFTGSRYFTIDQEEVEFHNATTIRIWFNEQSADFPSHWHTAMEILMPG